MEFSQDPMITTLDNPWNPFEEPEEWQDFDHEHGYDLLLLLARFLPTTFDPDANAPAVTQLEWDLAIDIMVNGNPYGNIIKVTKESCSHKGDDGKYIIRAV